MELFKAHYLLLQREDQRKFQNSLSRKKIIIFGETSMIGQRISDEIDRNSKKVSSTQDKSFGGFILYFSFNLRRLPTVGDSALCCSIQKTNDALFGVILIESFQQYFPLTSCHRQLKSDQA